MMNTHKKKEIRVAVLILGYNHAKTVLETLTCATQQNYNSYEVIYIDNASQDDSVLLVQNHFPNIRIITHSENIGYTGAYAKALSTVFSEGFNRAILLNPDTHFHKDWLSSLIECAEKHPNAAFIQPKIYLWEEGETNIFNTAGNKIHFLGIGFCGRYKERDIPPLKNDQRIPYASGASLLVKKEIYEKLPGFDETFFAYLEDQDIGWQANMLGYENILCTKSSLWHKYDFHKESLNGFKMYLLERNRLIFLLKYYEVKTLFLLFPALVILEMGIILHSIFNRYFMKKMRSYIDFLILLPKTLKKRKEIQKIRIRNDRELFSKLSPKIHFQEIDSSILSVANRFFRWYYRHSIPFL